MIVISIRYDAKHDVAFLSYKGGTFRELTKRDLEMKTRLQRATEIIEQTKDSDGFYHAGDYPTRYLNDSELYDVVAEMESAVYDIRQKFQRSKLAQAEPAESEVTAS